MILGHVLSDKKADVDFPGGPVVRTLYFQRRGLRLNPWSGNCVPKCHVAWPKENPKGRQMLLVWFGLRFMYDANKVIDINACCLKIQNSFSVTVTFY